MLAVRLVKIGMVAAAAIFALLVAVDNIVDYGTNYAFVRHTLSMDTTFPGNALTRRAITSPSVWAVAYSTSRCWPSRSSSINPMGS